MIKKLLSIAMIFLLSIFLFACKGEVTTTQTWDAVFPDYQDEYDMDVFEYGTIIFYFTYDQPLETSDRQTRIEKEFTDLKLDQAHFSKRYLSKLTQYVGLTYNDKAKLFTDFQMIQDLYKNGDITQPMIELNTIGEEFKLTKEVSINDLISQTDKYFGTEVTYPTIDFVEISVLKLGVISSNQAPETYSTYQTYLERFPDNDFELAESYFEENILLVAIVGHSSSIIIKSIINVFYLDGDVLEIAIHATAASTNMTEDIIFTHIVASVLKDDFKESTIINTHFHTFYENGYLADKPYHNSLEK